MPAEGRAVSGRASAFGPRCRAGNRPFGTTRSSRLRSRIAAGMREWCRWEPRRELVELEALAAEYVRSVGAVTISCRYGDQLVCVVDADRVVAVPRAVAGAAADRRLESDDRSAPARVDAQRDD